MVLVSPRSREAQAVTVIQRFYRRWRPTCEAKPLRSSNIANLRERMQSLRRRHESYPVSPHASFAKPGMERKPQKAHIGSKKLGQPRMPSPIGVKNPQRTSFATAAGAKTCMPPKPPRPFSSHSGPVEGVRAVTATPAPAPAPSPHTIISSPRIANPAPVSRCADEDDIVHHSSVDWKHHARVRDSTSTVATASSAAPTRSIMSFLDEVDEHLRTDVSIMSNAAPSQLGDSTVEDGSALKTKNSMLGLEVEDKRQIIAQLRCMLEDQKAKTMAAERAAALIWENKMQKMKEDAEKVCERQMKMCDRLMQDKAQLTSKCAQLAEEFNALKRQYENRVTEMQQGATKELARQRNNWVAMEKMRREQWEKDRTKEIKEMTIKGLEPEVEKMLNERKHERRRLEEQYREKADNLRLELQELTATKVREAKELCLLEQEAAVEKEREIARQKLQEERARVDQAIREERAKCANDLQEQERCAQHERLQYQQRASEQQKQFEREVSAQAEERIAALKQKLVQEEDNHERELRQCRAQLEERKTELETSFQQKVEDEKSKLARELKEKCAQECAAQLEALKEKLGREASEKERLLRQKENETTDELKNTHAMALRQQQEQLRAREKDAMEATKEKEVVQLQKQFFEKELNKVTQDKNALETVLAHSKAAHQAQLDECEQLKTAMAASMHAHEQALAESEQRATDMVKASNEALARERVEREREVEAAQKQEKIMLEGVEERIKRALAAKDEQIRQLKEQVTCAECKVDEFQYLLQRQREELLGKLT